MEVREVLPRNILNAPPDPLAIHDALGCFHECIVGYGLVSFKEKVGIQIVVSACPTRVYARAPGPARMAVLTPCGARTYAHDSFTPYT